MKVIVAGSRTNVTLDQVRLAITNAARQFRITEIVSGTAKGADQFGEIVAKEMDIPIKQFPAKWKDLSVASCCIKSNLHGTYNALAGHNRNKEMAEYADALIAIWDGQSNGTRNIINTMKKLGKKTFISTP